MIRSICGTVPHGSDLERRIIIAVASLLATSVETPAVSAISEKLNALLELSVEIKLLLVMPSNIRVLPATMQLSSSSMNTSLVASLKLTSGSDGSDRIDTSAVAAENRLPRDFLRLCSTGSDSMSLVSLRFTPRRGRVCM